MRREWARLHKGKNIMTPTWLEDWGNNFDTFACIETGGGFDNEPIFGVTIIRSDDGRTFERDTDRNSLFYSLKEAQEYARDLSPCALHLHSYVVGHNPSR